MIQRLNIYFSGYNSNESEKKNRDIRHVYKNKRTVKEQYVKSLCEISKKNDIYITTPTPEFLYDIPSETSKRLMKNNEEPIRITLDEYNNRNKTTKELLKELQTCNIKLMSPTNYLCNKDGCFASKDGRPIYKDDDHLSEYGNKLLIPMFSLLLEQ